MEGKPRISGNLKSNCPTEFVRDLFWIWEKGRKNILAHFHAADEKDRNYLTVKISYDEGKTWDHEIQVDFTSHPDKLP